MSRTSSLLSTIYYLSFSLVGTSISLQTHRHSGWGCPLQPGQGHSVDSSGTEETETQRRGQRRFGMCGTQKPSQGTRLQGQVAEPGCRFRPHLGSRLPQMDPQLATFHLHLLQGQLFR